MNKITNVNTTVIELFPLGGATNSGLRLGYLVSTARAALNDTITITNASEVLWASLKDTDETFETATYATNVITLTRDDTTNVLGLVVYRV